jgi:hypothetical protein
MQPVALMPPALMSLLLDEAGGSWMEFVLIASLAATVGTLVVLALGKSV